MASGMSKVLLTFGDSWPAGAKLENKSLAFPTLVAQQLDVELIDCSSAATSFDHVVMAFINFLEKNYDANNQYTALFCVTDISRGIAWHPNAVPPARDQLWERDPQTLELQVSNNIDNLSPTYFKYIHSERLELFNYHKNIVLLNLLCRRYNIVDYYVHNFYNPKFEFRIVDINSFYPGTLRQVLETAPIREYVPSYNPNTPTEANTRNSPLLFPGGHPTIAGHDVIATELTKWIKDSGR
jgi:hypothetical protein